MRALARQVRTRNHKIYSASNAASLRVALYQSGRTAHMEHSKAAAFFDLDRTLLAVNSATLFAFYEKRHGHASHWLLLKSLIHILLYHLNVIDIEAAYTQLIREYKGTSEQALRARIQHFAETELLAHIQPGARKRLEHHRREGHPLVLLTSNSQFQSEVFVHHLQMDHALANTFDTVDGHLTGTAQSPLCFGAGKVTLASRWSSQHRISLSHSFYYTDSYSDLPMLEAVGHPRVVNPDPKLRKEARRRSWPIEDWQQK